ncbi:MAG: tetratricopeptide repeat protein [Myxococcota bacterium]
MVVFEQRRATRRPAWGIALAIGCALLVEPSLITAQELPPDGALEHYREGREHFNAGRYEDAKASLRLALVLDPGSPTLLYNLARVSELMGQLEEAITYYREYLLVLAPDAEEERSRARETLNRLVGALQQQRQNPEPEVETYEPAPPTFRLAEPIVVEEPGVADPLFWIVGGTGVAAVITGSVVGIVALRERNSLDNFVAGPGGCITAEECQAFDVDPDESWDSRAAAARNKGIAADILFIAGGAALVSAALLYFLRSRSVEQYPENDVGAADDSPVAPFLSADGSGAVLGVEGSL